jgi:hypothetical protein
MKLIEKNLKEIKKIFLNHKVIFAYLFGSQIEGNIGGLSDIDIAIYFDEKIPESERFDRKLKIAAEFSFLLKRDDIDIVVLNDAYPLLQHRIIKQGKIIFSSDEKKRIDFEVKAVLRYLDFKPLLEKYTKETLHG